jgi:hypothetical protein
LASLEPGQRVVPVPYIVGVLPLAAVSVVVLPSFAR